MLRFFAQSAKAFLAALIAGLSALASVLVGDVGIGEVTHGQWVTIALATVVAFAAVWGVPNRAPR